MADSTQKNYTVYFGIVLLHETSCSCGSHAACGDKYGNIGIGSLHLAVELSNIADKTLSASPEHKAYVIGLNDTFSVSSVVAYDRNEALLRKVVHKRVVALLVLIHAVDHLNNAVYISRGHRQYS